jgi:hypothetical protein
VLWKTVAQVLFNYGKVLIMKKRRPKALKKHSVGMSFDQVAGVG